MLPSALLYCEVLVACTVHADFSSEIASIYLVSLGV